MDIDQLLEPENDDQPKKVDKDATKRRLQSLKEMMAADPVQLDTDKILLNTGDMPLSQNAKYIDYDEEKKNYKEFADQVVTNIILTYIKSPKLLDSPRLKDLKQKDIVKYSRLLLLVEVAERNMITLQESIDAGDMSSEMFHSVDQAQNRMQMNMAASEKHIKECETYWSNYADQYGIENEETKIVQETEAKPDEKKRMVMDATSIIEAIRNTHNHKNEEQEQKKRDSAK